MAVCLCRSFVEWKGTKLRRNLFGWTADNSPILNLTWKMKIVKIAIFKKAQAKKVTTGIHYLPELDTISVKIPPSIRSVVSSLVCLWSYKEMSTCDPMSKGGCLWVIEQVNQSDLACSESFAQIIFKALKRENYAVYYKKEKIREMCAQIWFVLIYYPENHLTALSIHHLTPCGGTLNQVNHQPKSTGSQCLL